MRCVSDIVAYAARPSGPGGASSLLPPTCSCPLHTPASSGETGHSQLLFGAGCCGMPLLANGYMHTRGRHSIISPVPYTIQDAFSHCFVCCFAIHSSRMLQPVCLCVCLSLSLSLSLSLCMYVCMYIRMCIRVCVCVYITHTHTHTHTHNPLIPHADTCIQIRDRARDIVILFRLPRKDAECNISKALARVALRILLMTWRTRRMFVVRRFHVASAVLALR
jgi:hypothetical protein